MLIVPSVPPKQVILVLFTVAESTGGSVIIRAGFRIITQPALTASRILTLYDPGERFTKFPEPSHVVPPFIESGMFHNLL
jgi:hypothetical protein